MARQSRLLSAPRMTRRNVMLLVISDDYSLSGDTSEHPGPLAHFEKDLSLTSFFWNFCIALWVFVDFELS